MTLSKKHIPASFPEAMDTVQSARPRRIGTSGWLMRLTEQEVVLKLHDTIIVRYLSNGSFIIDHGGWKTVSTKSWINRALRATGFRVFTKKKVLSIAHYDGGDESIRVFGILPVTLDPKLMSEDWSWSWRKEDA